MKKLLFGIIMIFLVGCLASAPVQDCQSTEIIPFQGMTKDQIYNKTLEWIHTQFRSGKDILQTQDKTAGKIIGNVVFSLQSGFTVFNFRSNVIIEAKDGKARMQIWTIEMNNNGSVFYTVPIMYIDEMKEAQAKFKAGYIAYMQTPAASQDW